LSDIKRYLGILSEIAVRLLRQFLPLRFVRSDNHLIKQVNTQGRVDLISHRTPPEDIIWKIALGGVSSRFQ